MARGQKLIDGSMWEERIINLHCISMGFLLMCMRGLGFLVLTWTTVVLLGGFVSGLEETDFWCLTFITLTQTTGLFDVFSTEKLSYVAKSALGMFRDKVRQKFRWMADIRWFHWVAIGVLVPYLPMMAIELCALVPIYMFGLLISAGISYWRVLQLLRLHDYRGSADGDQNLKPALQILYNLVVLQGTLFSFWLIFSFPRTVKKVVKEYHFDDRASISLRDYEHETRIGCEKDPTFARGRNLITYAVGLMMDFKLPDSYRSGVRILDVLIRQQESLMLDSDSRRHMLIKHLVGSASSSHILLKLLQMLDSRGPHDREMRERAARIMAYLAGEIHLDQFPRGIQCITSLLDTFEEYRLVQPYQRDWLLETCEQDWNQEALRLPRSDSDEREDGELREAYKELLLQGLRILRKLAADEDNCRVMRNTKGLLPKIMAPVTSDLLHSIQDHVAWSSIVEGSLRVMGQLVTAPGETGAKLRHEISTNKDAINTMESILRCDECGEEPAELHKQAMGILTQLYMDEKYSSMITESRENFIKMLLHIFTDDNKGSYIRKFAGEALAMLSSEGGSNATIILQVNADAVDSLTKMLLRVRNNKYRISAAQILEHLCSYYTKDDECLQELKKSMTDAMPKLLGEILCSGLTGEIRTGNEANQAGSSVPKFDIENPHDGSQDGGRGNSSSRQNDEQEEEFQAALLLPTLLCLCVTVCDIFISADQDLASQFGAIDIAKNLQKMVERNCQLRADCLRIMKLTTKMVISMMKHKGSYVQQDLESLMESLSIASKSMLDLDCSMVFASGDHGATTTKPIRTLASLVKEAQELVDKKRGTGIANCTG